MSLDYTTSIAHVNETVFRDDVQTLERTLRQYPGTLLEMSKFPLLFFAPIERKPIGVTWFDIGSSTEEKVACHDGDGISILSDSCPNVRRYGAVYAQQYTYPCGKVKLVLPDNGNRLYVVQERVYPEQEIDLSPFIQWAIHTHTG